MLSAIPEEERATEVKDLDLDRDVLSTERALGVHWCIQSNSFRFKIIMPEKAPTRKNILSIVSSVYDPLGILAPVILPARRILQELCRMKLQMSSYLMNSLVSGLHGKLSFTSWTTSVFQDV